MQAPISALGAQQLFVGALLDDAPVFHHQDQISVPDGGQAVGDDEGSALGAQGIHSLLDEHLGAGIHGRGRFIQDEQCGLGQKGAGDGNQLAFAGGDGAAILVDDGVIAFRQGVDEAIDVLWPRR